MLGNVNRGPVHSAEFKGALLSTAQDSRCTSVHSAGFKVHFCPQRRIQGALLSTAQDSRCTSVHSAGFKVHFWADRWRLYKGRWGSRCTSGLTAGVCTKAAGGSRCTSGLTAGVCTKAAGVRSDMVDTVRGRSLTALL